MKEFNLMRHGHKFPPGQETGDIESSELSSEERVIWQEAVTRLGIEDSPELTFENIHLIDEVAKGVYEKLPSKATVIFTSTMYPRARLTADLMASSLTRLARENNDKEVGVAFLWESKENAQKEDSMTNIMDVSREYVQMWELMQRAAAQKNLGSDSLEAYFKQNDGNKTHPDENELVKDAVNLDLASDHSIYRDRIQRFRKQLRSLEEGLTSDVPVYFFGVGHHSNLITLDLALNHKDHYDSADEIPEPLAIWQADREGIERLIHEDE